MSAIGGNLKESLTQDEKKFYGQIFKTLDPKHTGSISGLAAKPLLEASGLPLPLLSEIWSIADPENSGVLNQFGFCVAMRLISHCQNGATLTPELAHKVAPQLARFTSIPITPSDTGLSSVNTGSRVSSSGSTASTQQLMIPVLLPQQAASFGAMFDKASSNGVLPGMQARDLFLKARLPTQILEKIWNLADQQQSGQLTRPQFIVAMHLIQSFLNKSMTILPTVIPEGIWNTAKQFEAKSPQQQYTAPQSPVVGQHQNAQSPPQQQIPLPHQHTQSQSQSLPLPPMPHKPARTGSTNLNTWVMSPEQKQQYGAVFESLDTKKEGLISGGAVATFLMTSKLGNDVLASIWELSNLDGSDTFNKQEFSIAMYLVQKKIAGFELPEETPAALIQSSSLNQQSPQQQFSPQLQGQQQYQRDAHQPASSSPVPPPQSASQSKSHLDELLDVFGTPSQTPSPMASTPDHYKPPVPQAPVSRAATHQTGHQPLGTSVTGGRAAFVPTSSFGQQLQHEQTGDDDESSDDDEGPELIGSTSHNRSAPPTIPGRDHKPTFDSPTPVQQRQATGPNYAALRSVNAPPPPPAQPAQPVQQASPNAFSVQPNSGFSGQPTGGFSNQDLGGFSEQHAKAVLPVSTGSISSGGSNSREISNQMTHASIDIANFSNQINSLSGQAAQASGKKDRAQKELNRILKVKEDIESKLIQLRTLYERETKQVKEVENVLIESSSETEKLNQELALAEASYHAEQTKLQQYQLAFEESQKKNQTTKERLGVLNAESTDLNQQLQDLTAKLRQSENMLNVLEGQVTAQEEENNEIRANIESITKAIADIEAKHSSMLSTSYRLEDENANLTDRHIDLSAEHAEKNLNYSTALSSGSAMLAGGAAALGVGGAIVAGAHHDSSQQDEADEVPTGSLDDFDDDEFGVPSIENKEVVGSPTNTTSGFGSVAKSASDSATTQTSDFMYQQQGQQQFALPFDIPHSETSSIQNNPSQSVRGDPDIPESPTSTIEEESAPPPPIVLSSQIMPEGAEDTPDQVLTGTSSNDNGESFEMVNHADADEMNLGESPLEAASTKEVETPSTALKSAESYAADDDSLYAVPGGMPSQTEDDLEPAESETATEPTEIETVKSATDELAQGSVDAPASESQQISDSKAIEQEPSQLEATKLDSTSASSEEHTDLEEAVPEKELNATDDDLAKSTPSGNDFDDLELASAPAEADQFPEVEASESELTQKFSSSKINDEFPPIKELEPADDDDSSSDDEEFHDSISTPAQLPRAASEIVSPLEGFSGFGNVAVPETVKEVDSAKTAVPASTANTSFNPFTMSDLQPAQATDVDDFENIQFEGFSKASANNNGTNMFDDLGLEDAQPETSFDNEFTGLNSTGFSFSQPAAASNAAAGDDWEQIFAGFGNDPNVQVAKEEAPSAPPSYDFSNQQHQTEAPFTFEKSPINAHPQAASSSIDHQVSGAVESSSKHTQSQQLAIEELQGMGFDEDSIINALTKNNWQIDLATNYLLDSA
ncbi:hypothetical protein CANARDRAFT_26885 [[Candida] arabinofermentans NRRL YB-2248]|uniref:EH domain-containing and endocytosis protein 1 n=1 Tax=[Candida] arabinofermentans NRRL YB-2248 TaxID=983967 RepID=A0A1E4T756_9ASCO|nr:hypothetical protein CANARDRAFT_26885 [[Candida] arabinofermentans NRRL YB-2248]